jgi:hypothetical protein
MAMSKMIPAVRHQVHVGSVGVDVLDPSTTECRVAITASKLTSAIKTDFKSSKIDVFAGVCVVCMIQILI